MAELAESSLEPTPLRRKLLNLVLVLVAIALIAGLALWVRSMLGGVSTPKRQVAKIAILPDTPPPPPPPKEEKKPEPPKDEAKQPVRDEPVKQEAPKAPDAPIKMEGQAGNGPSAFGAGTVSHEYQGGAPVVGASGGSAADRAQERFYANSVRQLLHDEIEKHLAADAGEITASFSIWIDPDGSIRRFELQPSGNEARDQALRAAFDQTSTALRLPSHGSQMTQPMRFKLSLRSL
jgi:outer membrane biosynthesis protein TonB